MKLKSYLTFILILTSAAVYAQKPDTAQAIVHYKFTHIRDTTQRDKPYTENMMLLLGRNASVYKSYDKIQRDAQLRKSMQEQIASGSTNFKMTSGIRASNTEYFQFPNEHKLFTKEQLVNSYLVEEPAPDIKWKITADTSTISGLACQKATTRFKGRDYIAWFCPDLPYRSGPWKLSGLPGLIVEAHDVKNDVIFKFDGFEKVNPVTANATASAAGDNAPGTSKVMMFGMDNANSNPNLIALPAKAIHATPKELADLKEVMAKDPQGFFNSQLGAMQSSMPGGGQAITKVNFQRAPGSQPASVTNNPIELPEKK